MAEMAQPLNNQSRTAATWRDRCNFGEAYTDVQSTYVSYRDPEKDGIFLWSGLDSYVTRSFSLDTTVQFFTPRSASKFFYSIAVHIILAWTRDCELLSRVWTGATFWEQGGASGPYIRLFFMLHFMFQPTDLFGGLL